MTKITIDRALVEQALETIEGLTRDRLFTAEWAGKHGATITALRAALAQQTLNATEECEHKADGWYAVQRVAGVTRVWPMTEAQALRAALAQQAEPQDAELSAALGWPGGISEPVLDRKTLLRQVADLRAALTQQAEPVAVAERERIAAQWDGCVTHQLDTFGPVDIGASIRAGELVEPVATVAENATTQQRVVETPPSDYRRGYWDGFNIGKREGRIEAEDALAQQDEPVTRYSVDQPLNYMTRCADGTEFINTVVMPSHAVSWAYTAPPQRKPLTEEEIDALPWNGSPRQFARAVERKVRGEV